LIFTHLNCNITLYFSRYRITGFGGIAVKKPAFVQQLDLTAVLFEISLHELMAEPLWQVYPSSGMLPMYSIWEGVPKGAAKATN
jgi:hypothetical protein